MPELSALIPLPRSWMAKAARWVLLAAVTVALAAILGYLYFKTEGADFKRQNEVLAALRSELGCGGLGRLDALVQFHVMSS